MEIAQHCDLVPVKCGGPPCERKFPVNQLRPVGFQQDGISDQRGSAECRRKSEESAAADASPGGASLFCQDRSQRDFRTLSEHSQHIANSQARDIPGVTQSQKVNCAVRSMRRLAVVPGEYGYPVMLLETLKKFDPTTPLGLATFTSLKAFRTLTPNVRL